MFEACDQYKTRRWSNAIAEGEVTGEQIKTLMLLLMFTGLRISDAATFSTDKLQGNNAFLFMHKTEEPVFTWLPDKLVQRLKAAPLSRGKYYFIGPVTERKETAADMWRRKLVEVFEMAGPWKIKPTPHRFRHTFARLLRQRGVPADDVATLRGHADPKITLKHYGQPPPVPDARPTRIVPRRRSPPRAERLGASGTRSNHTVGGTLARRCFTPGGSKPTLHAPAVQWDMETVARTASPAT